MAAKGKRALTVEERIDVSLKICELHKQGYDIFSCCSAFGISYKSFWLYLHKYEQVRIAYAETTKARIELNSSIVLDLADSALVANLKGVTEIEEVVITEKVKKRQKDGSFAYEDAPPKKITKTTKKAPSITAVKLAYELQGKLKKEDTPPPPLEQDLKQIAERQNWLEGKLKEQENK